MSSASEESNKGNYASESHYLAEAVALAEKEFGERDNRLAISLISIATSYFSQGKIEEAFSPAIRAWNLNIRNLGKNDPEALASGNIVAMVYFKTNRLAEAEQVFRTQIRSIESVSTISPDLQFLLGSSYGSLAFIYGKQRRFEEASAMCITSLRLLEEVRAFDSPTMITMRTFCAGLGD